MKNWVKKINIGFSLSLGPQMSCIILTVFPLLLLFIPERPFSLVIFCFQFVAFQYFKVSRSNVTKHFDFFLHAFNLVHKISGKFLNFFRIS